MGPVNADTAPYCFLDFDFDNHRKKLGVCAAFVDATDTRYGFSSKDLRHLGGSELSRISDLIATDHEWSQRNTDCGGIQLKPPPCGSRVVVQLFWDIAPLACENFATLCANGSTTLLLPQSQQKNTPIKAAKPPPMGQSGKALTYRNTVVHRIVPGFVMQGGDLVFGNGSGGESIFNGKKFKDERAGLLQKHDRRGVLSMGNSGRNSNTSQFFLTFQPTPQCDGKHVVFGQVVSGWSVLDHAESHCATTTTTVVTTTITDCGIHHPLYTPGAGYWYDQPDNDAFHGISPVFMVRPRVLVIAPTNAVADKFRKGLVSYTAVTCWTVADPDPNRNEEGKESLEPSVLMDRVTERLSQFGIDVVVVAPACKSVVAGMVLPAGWESCSLDKVVLEAKPVEALELVRTKSWLAERTQWKLDGAV